MKKGNQRARVPKKKGKAISKGKPIRQKGTRTISRLSTGNIPNIVDRYKYAVVNIEVVKQENKSTSRRRREGPWGLDAPGESQSKNTMNIGTGFFFDPRGYILTNEHVISNADEIYIRLFDQEEGVLAKVVGTDYASDLAILKVDPPKPCKTLPLATSDKVRVGEWVVAIGCPLGLDHSVTVGIVSATERPIVIGDRNYPHLLQTDAAINRGNSGGPLINMRGQVVGMNTAVSASSQGIGFAIPSDFLKKAVHRMMPKNK